MYWNGSAWVRLPAGSNGQILQINGGILGWANPDFICGVSKLWDIDGNTYNTVAIGSQCWTKENLKVTKYRDGTAIPLNATGDATGYSFSNTWGNLTTGAYTIYGNQASSDPNATNYGFLYNVFAASDSRKLCPIGWHVPSDAEWTTLTDYLGGLSAAGGKMKSTGTTYWYTPNTSADNSSGFSALPGGYRGNDGYFGLISFYAFFLSSDCFPRRLEYNNDDVLRLDCSFRYYGGSVRCLKD
jgi:uncharacterized protein (TIGR02145 family)